MVGDIIWYHIILDPLLSSSYIYICVYNRRKFRSQTSDNMDRWKAEQRRGREKRKIRRKKSRRERVRRKKMQMREKVGKSRNTVFFQWFGAPEGRKVGSLERRVRSQLARWEMKNCLQDEGLSRRDNPSSCQGMARRAIPESGASNHWCQGISLS